MSLLSLPSKAARLTLPRWLPLVLVFVAAAVLRHLLTANSNVSWDLTLADKVLDGKRLYVDLIEVNPPATIYFYLLPAWLCRLSGLPAEFFVDVLVMLAAALSLWLSNLFLRRTDILHSTDGWLLATVAAAAMLILPAQTFGEREPIVLIAFMPLLALYAVRANGDRPELWMVIAAGICGGLVAIIKPFFVAPIISTAAMAAVFARSWRPVFALENWIAAGLLAAYSVFVVTAYPQFITHIVPLVMTVYVPAKMPLTTLIFKYATPLWLGALLLTALIKRRAMLAPPFCLLLAASFGFAVAFFVQQKGWPYQSYPMLALALIAFVLAFIEHWRRPSANPAERRTRMAVTLAAVLLVGTSFSWMNTSFDVSALARDVRAIKPHPKILTLSLDSSVGFPLTRMVEGTWVGRTASLWISGDVWYRRMTEKVDAQTLARLKTYAAYDRTLFTQDLAHGRPDVVLVDHRQGVPWQAWINSYAPLATQMKAYHKVRSVGEIDILARDVDR